MSTLPGVDPAVAPSGTGCAECEATGGWWFHLRRCAQCGHIGCCDSSPSQHASGHAVAAGHPVIRSFEPGEAWFWNYQTEEFYDDGPALTAPDHHPLDQPVPGPAGRVPSVRRVCQFDSGGGLHHKTTAQAGSSARPLACPEGREPPLARDFPESRTPGSSEHAMWRLVRVGFQGLLGGADHHRKSRLDRCVQRRSCPTPSVAARPAGKLTERGLDGAGSDGPSLVGQRDDEFVGGPGAVRAERLEHAGGGRAQLGRRVGHLGKRAVVGAEVMPRLHRAGTPCHDAATCAGEDQVGGVGACWELSRSWRVPARQPPKETDLLPHLLRVRVRAHLTHFGRRRRC
jgi:hypothetical protein